MDRYEECIKIFREKVHVELDTLISCREGVNEEAKIIGRVESLADVIRFMEGRLPDKNAI